MTYQGLYLFIMKILFIALTGYTVHTMMRQSPYKMTYDPAQDQFLHWLFAVLPCAIIVVVISSCQFLFGSAEYFSIIHMCWEFSILLESIAILPQLVTLQNYREVENLTGNYIFLMVRQAINDDLQTFAIGQTHS